MTAVKQAACSKAVVQWHQTTCHPDEFWTKVWCMWWRQTSGDSDWSRAPTCTRLSDTMVRSRVATWTSELPVWSQHGIRQVASAIPAEQVRCVHGDPSTWLTWRQRSVGWQVDWQFSFQRTWWWLHTVSRRHSKQCIQHIHRGWRDERSSHQTPVHACLT